MRMKRLRPDCRYIGLDVQDYNQTSASTSLADEYRTVPSSQFAEAIAEHHGSVDAVISSHNLEHCNEPMRVLDAMFGALRPAGWIYLAFPSEQSCRFPSRSGTLNFYDDPTHQWVPVVAAVIDAMVAANVAPTVVRQRYRPLIPAAIGLALEPISAVSRKVMPFGSTWALYGFESIIWGCKRQ